MATRYIAEMNICLDSGAEIRTVVFDTRGMLRKPFDPESFRAPFSFGDLAIRSIRLAGESTIIHQVGVMFDAHIGVVTWDVMPTVFSQFFARLDQNWKKRLMFEMDMSMPIV